MYVYVPHHGQGLRLLSSDPHPNRPSAKDLRLFGAHAISRVGGSLAVTRALGDGYLKTVELRYEKGMNVDK